MSCSLLTAWLYSLNCPSYDDVICGISCLCSLDCFSCGDFICDTATICLITYTTIGTTLTIVSTIDGSTIPLIIFCAFEFMLSYSPFTPEPKAPPSSILFFLLRTLLGKFATTFFLFSSVICISSLVLLTLADGFYGLSF